MQILDLLTPFRIIVFFYFLSATGFCLIHARAMLATMRKLPGSALVSACRPYSRLSAQQSSKWDDLSIEISFMRNNMESLSSNVAVAKIEDMIKTLQQAKSQLQLPEPAKPTSTMVDKVSQPPVNPSLLAKNVAEQTVKSEMITARSTDYSAWYNDVISASDMVDQSPVRGCMVIKPWGMGVWDLLREELDRRIKDTGVSNAYFPLFIPLEFLAKEAEHVDGFAKECAVVTHHRLKNIDGELCPDPEAKLEEPLIVRPTSETMIWKMFGRWISSYRDLPLKINQWANVVRWEMRTRPFLRTTEFLWQEGHTAHSSAEDAVDTSMKMLDLYASVCQDLLAMPTIKGEKSPTERFAGADKTFTIEALMQNGWALQSGTSHFLGQNFARAFDVFFQNERKERELVWATSWGVSTRLIGGMIMSHSDDKGLVLPPKVAPIQVVIVPISTGDVSKDGPVLEVARDIARQLELLNMRVKVDDRQNLRAGAKYFEWERKGLPLRLDVGPKDIAKGQVVVASRHDGQKRFLPLDSQLPAELMKLLDTMQVELFQKAAERQKQQTFRIESYGQMKSMLESKDLAQQGFYLVPWRCDAKNEKAIKEECKATIRCYPLDMQSEAQSKSCFYSGQPATHMAIFARAF